MIRLYRTLLTFQDGRKTTREGLFPDMNTAHETLKEQAEKEFPGQQFGMLTVNPGDMLADFPAHLVPNCRPEHLTWGPKGGQCLNCGGEGPTCYEVKHKTAQGKGA